MKKSYLVALAIMGLVILWLASGLFTREAAAPDPSDAAAELMTVGVRPLGEDTYAASIVIQGRTEAVRRVDLKAQTDGKVAALPVAKGARVRQGDVVCTLAVDDRAARLAEARALAAQRKLEFDAATELAAKGHRAPTQVAAAKAQHDAAVALVKRMEVELAYTQIRAPFDGVLDQRPAEVGSYLQKGDPCGTLLDLDPYLVVGEVSERTVAQLAPGMAATAILVDGAEVSGRIRYVAAAGQQETRTFRVELEVPNPDHALKDGVTAEIRIPVAEKHAHVLPASALVLNDEGVLGVRTVDDDIVQFRPVTIIGDDARGIWVTGLPNRTTLITVGQQFVKNGQRVKVEPDRRVEEARAP